MAEVSSLSGREWPQLPSWRAHRNSQWEEVLHSDGVVDVEEVVRVGGGEGGGGTLAVLLFFDDNLKQ